MLKRKFWKQDSGLKNSITRGEFEIPFNLLRHRSWDSMTHETCTLILQCLVGCSCQKSSVKRAIQGHSGQMFSKTMLIGLSIFRCGHEKSVHGRPSWELAPFDCTSQIIEDFASWCKLVSKQCCSSGCAEECGAVHVSTQFFILDKAKALPIRIGSQTV